MCPLTFTNPQFLHSMDNEKFLAIKNKIDIPTEKHFSTNLQNWLISILVSFADLNCSWKLMSLNPMILHPNLLFLSNRKRMRFSRASLHRKWMRFWVRSHFRCRTTYRSVMRMKRFSSLSLMSEILRNTFYVFRLIIFFIHFQKRLNFNEFFDEKPNNKKAKRTQLLQKGLFNIWPRCIVDGYLLLRNEMDSWNFQHILHLCCLNFERLHVIINEAYAENFSCLSHWEVRDPHPLYNLGRCWTSPFKWG